ncbi:MAG: response regulator [Parachlamydiales bacterium]|nr:response regulator [Parachlamydiales bacterium]
MTEEKPSILIITQDITTKLFFKSQLENKYHLIEKKTFEDAIKISESTNLDIVIVDDKMPDAIDLCFQLKKRKRLFTVPIILVTARLKKTYFQKAIKAGVFDIIYEPLDDIKLKNVLDKCEKEKQKIKKVSSVSFNIKKGFSR